jgi:hypothetical protein
MSQHQSHESDRGAAYRGLIIGAILIGILLVTVVKFTNAHYTGGAEGGKAASISLVHTLNGALDA